MKKSLQIITSGVFLAACTDTAQTCSDYGCKLGTNEYASCQMQVDQQNRDRMGALSEGFKAMGSSTSPHLIRPTKTSCCNNGYGTINRTTYQQSVLFGIIFQIMGTDL